MAKEFPRRLSSVTREGVLSAIKEFDRLGREAFLAKYGFDKARKYFVWHEGKAYDSKAILGAAFSYLPGSPQPLTSVDFSGGYLYAVPALKKLGFSFEPIIATARTEKGKRNPPWTRDQVILALELYVKHDGRDPGVRHPDVIEVSALLRQMATEAGSQTYRNPSGVIMKMMNFRSLDPSYTSKGGKGLKGASELDKAIWSEFYGDRQGLAVAAEAVREGVKASMDNDQLDDLQSYTAKEGKVSYRFHRRLERDRKIVELRKASALKKHGTLECEGCGFDFVKTYGSRGFGFIEAHHINPVHAMKEGDETSQDDLALICSNCHRMIHKAKPWLTIAQLKDVIAEAKSVTS